MGKGNLVAHEKRILKSGLVLEVTIWSIDKTDKCPEGLKYNLICVNPDTKEQVLFDNHQPKGPHFHVDNIEFEYNFKDVDILIQDFQEEVQKKFGVEI